MPSLDVIIVTYNSEAWVDRVLQSLGDLRVIIVDNASTDGTVEKIRRHDAELIVNEENRYLSGAWIQALQRSQAAFVALLNPDCEVLTAGWDEVAIDHFRKHPKVGIIGPRLLDEDGSVQYTAHPFRSKRWALAQVLMIPAIRARIGRSRDWRWDPAWQRDSLREVDVVSGACLIVRRSMLDEIGGLDQGYRLYWEEDDLCMRAKRAGYQVVLHPNIEVMHAWAQSTRQVEPGVLSSMMRNSFDRYFVKHHGRWFGALLRGLRACSQAAGGLVRRGQESGRPSS